MYRLYNEKKLATKKHPLSEEQEKTLKLDELLITAGAMREKVARVLPQENGGG